MYQNIINGLNVLSFLILIIFIIIYIRNSKELNLFDLTEFQTVLLI